MNSEVESMVRVRVMLFATLREKYGRKEITVECDGTLRDAVAKAAEVLGPEFVSEVYENGEVRRDRIILVNGRHVQFANPDKLEDGAVISIFPPIAGG